MSDNDESLPRLLGGRYRLEAKLGSGGMGVVYRATDQTMHRPVAVKLIRGVDGVALDEEVAGRFLREAKNTARIQHEHIIEVFDLGRSDQGDMFFVMELLEGESLSTKIRRDGKLGVDASVHIARQMCAALHVAHAAGIIHRDLKPANVMLVERSGDAAYVKVLDFGVAKSYTPDQQTQLTHTGMLVGTVEYMAPEQIMGRKVDARTDIYSLGVMMYRMFTGKAPFRDGGVPALIHSHLNVAPKSMIDTTPEVPSAVDRVVLRCLAKAPDQRYESMEEVSRALKAAIEPPDLGLVSLEYNADEDGDQTELVKPANDARYSPSSARAPVNATFDDATMKMDRPEGSSGAKRRPIDPNFDRTAIMSREESTAKRPVPDDVTRIDNAAPRECAMCRTMNAPHARACTACGVSLAREEQEAVRARVTAPRTAHLAAPQMPPPTSGAYPAPTPQSFRHGAQGAPQGASSMHGPHGQQMAWGAMPPGPQPNQPRGQGYLDPSQTSPSMWRRFLTWTGIRGR
jgi:serine/threonine protein kinase